MWEAGCYTISSLLRWKSVKAAKDVKTLYVLTIATY